jgi:hypothetical protein
MKTCIIVASHIENAIRTRMLLKCLYSLINQTVKIPIYLSISFGTYIDKEIFKRLIEKADLIKNEILNIYYEEMKRSQFRHIDKVINRIKGEYKYVMFCDDDDTYDLKRVEKFMIMMEHGISMCKEGQVFVGGCEISDNIPHSKRFYEYWCYCIKIDIIIKFMRKIKNNNYDNYIDHIMCDVLFATYLRVLSNRHAFIFMNDKLYNYNINDYSITGKIEKELDENKNKIKTIENNFEEYMEGLNKGLEEHIDIDKRNIFLHYSTDGMLFEDILKLILGDNYKYKNDINKRIIEELKEEYERIESLCNILYELKM